MIDWHWRLRYILTSLKSPYLMESPACTYICWKKMSKSCYVVYHVHPIVNSSPQNLWYIPCYWDTFNFGDLSIIIFIVLGQVEWQFYIDTAYVYHGWQIFLLPIDFLKLLNRIFYLYSAVKIIDIKSFVLDVNYPIIQN